MKTPAFLAKLSTTISISWLATPKLGDVRRAKAGT
jgi:hypothetical protein